MFAKPEFLACVKKASVVYIIGRGSVLANQVPMDQSGKRKHSDDEKENNNPKTAKICYEICYIFSLSADLWKEVAQWLLDEETGKSALLPLICKHWNNLYKSLELWRLFECLKDRRASDVIKAAFCRKLCWDEYFTTVSIYDRETDSWLFYHGDLGGYQIEDSPEGWIPKDFYGRDLVFSFYEHGRGNGIDVEYPDVEIRQPAEGSFLRRLVSWEGLENDEFEGTKQRLVEDFASVILGDRAIAEEFILFMRTPARNIPGKSVGLHECAKKPSLFRRLLRFMGTDRTGFKCF